jgi:hypothetical protein
VIFPTTGYAMTLQDTVFRILFYFVEVSFSLMISTIEKCKFNTVCTKTKQEMDIFLSYCQFRFLFSFIMVSLSFLVMALYIESWYQRRKKLPPYAKASMWKVLKYSHVQKGFQQVSLHIGTLASNLTK